MTFKLPWNVLDPRVLEKSSLGHKKPIAHRVVQK